MAYQPPLQPQPQTNIFYDPNLPPGPYFTLGRMPSSAEAAARRRQRERQRQREQQHRLLRPTRPALHFTLPTPSPISLVTVAERMFEIQLSSVPPVLRWLPNWFLKPGMEIIVLGLLQHPPKFFEFMCNYKGVINASEATRYLSIAITILRMRWAFKRLANVIIVRSINRRRSLPVIDPISLEPMTNPIVIYSISSRWRYAYDATSLIAHIRTQLSNCSYGYPDPQTPRNPITNVEYTIYQLYSAYVQLMTRGKTCWQLGAYLAERGNMEIYTRQFIVPIYRHDCVREVLDVTNMEGAVTIIEFIYNTISEARGVNLGHMYAIFEQAFHSPRLRTHPYLSAWRKLYARSLVECSTISVDRLVLIHGNDKAITELADITGKLVRCFPAFFEDVKSILGEEMLTRATQSRAQQQ